MEEKEKTTEGQETQQVYILIDSVIEVLDDTEKSYEIRLYVEDVENIHYQIVDTSNEPPEIDLIYKRQSDAFSEWKTIIKTIASKEIDRECKNLRKKCNTIIAKAQNKQGALPLSSEEEGTEGDDEK